MGSKDNWSNSGKDSTKKSYTSQMQCCIEAKKKKYLKECEITVHDIEYMKSQPFTDHCSTNKSQPNVAPAR